MIKYLKYLKYVIRHKWFVMIECFKRKQYWLGITHDWSKFLPSEFFPYANFFYGKKPKKVRDETGYYKPTDTGDLAFDFAWLLHQKRNKHHWQWWILPTDEEGLKVFEMPMKYRIEMLCDWFGAGRAQGTPDSLAWYKKSKDKMTLGDETRKWIENELGYNKSNTSSEFICKCGKMKGWITEGKETEPCPECGRIYLGYYDKKNLTISGKEIKK